LEEGDISVCPICGALLADGMRVFTDAAGKALGCEECVKIIFV
jgi:hypothetical protein